MQTYENNTTAFQHNLYYCGVELYHKNTYNSKSQGFISTELYFTLVEELQRFK